MAVAVDLLAQLASPELALVDPELAAELRSTLSPVEDRWLRPPARVEDASAESEDPPVRLADDAGYAASRDTQRLHDDEFIVATPPEQTPAEEPRLSSHYPVLPAPKPEEASFEESPPRSGARIDEASAESDDDASALRAVTEVLRKAEAVAERVLVDEHVTTMPDQTPAEDRTRSHYPVLPASDADAEATDATDAALRRIREGLAEADASPSRKRRIRRGFTLASGVVAACAVAALGADVRLHVAQLPSWLQF